MLLHDLVIHDQDLESIREQLRALEDEFHGIRVIKESTEHASDLLNNMFDETIKQFEAAKRGLGLANKLSGDAGKKHRKRVIQNMNKIRGNIKRMERLMRKQR